MDAWAQPVAFILLFVACGVLGLMSAESRSEFNGIKATHRERWFPHSRKD
jgi:hypothetical protein